MGFIQMIDDAARSGDQERLLAVLAILLILLLVCFPVHEFAHAWTAVKLGDDTPRLQGRLTLNPFAHLDIWGTLLILFTGFGWAKAVPVVPTNLRGNQRMSMALVSFAGPFSNFLLAALFVMVMRIAINYENAPDWLFTVCDIGVTVNLSLLFFNLIPIPPLDGSKILWAYLPEQMDSIMYFLSRFGFAILLLASRGGFLSGLINQPVNMTYEALIKFFMLF